MHSTTLRLGRGIRSATTLMVSTRREASSAAKKSKTAAKVRFRKTCAVVFWHRVNELLVRALNSRDVLQGVKKVAKVEKDKQPPASRTKIAIKGFQSNDGLERCVHVPSDVKRVGRDFQIAAA